MTTANFTPITSPADMGPDLGADLGADRGPDTRPDLGRVGAPDQRDLTERGQVVAFRASRRSPPDSRGAAMDERPAPQFTWEALERQLTALAVTPTQRALAPILVSATRKQARSMSSEQVLREVLCIASVLMDETFHLDSEEGEMS